MGRGHKGEYYIIAVSNYSSSEGFAFEWTGSALLSSPFNVKDLITSREIIADGEIYYEFRAPKELSSYDITWDYSANTIYSSYTGVGPHKVRYTESGEVSINLIAINLFGCSIEHSIQLPVKNHLSNFEPQIVVYPNPTKNYLNVIYNFDLNNEYRIYITNISGKLVKVLDENYLHKEKNKQTINLHDFTNGIYYLIIENKDSRSKQLLQHEFIVLD